jgi:acetyl-CoA acyltransferase 1
MSLFDMNSLVDPSKLSEELFENENASNCLIPMGQTSEILAEKFGLKREDLDKFALESQTRAKKARENGLFKDEIEPIEVMHLNQKTKKLEKTLVEHDDGIRETSLESLAKLKPAFKREGLSTGGNSSQTTDGAGGVLLMTRAMAERLNLKILGKIINHVVVGVPPEIMGVGPAYAIPRVLESSGLSKDDISVYEINEAFASQCTYCVNKLGLDPAKVNPKGGAIALGHPLGCTGARQVSTLIYELHRIKKKFGVISMCIGTGMGAAAVFEAEF